MNKAEFQYFVKMIRKILLLVLLGSCSAKSPTPADYPETESDILNQFIKSAPIQYISLDEIPIDTIVLKQENFHYKSDGTPINEHNLQLKAPIIERENIYAYDKFSEQIIRLNKNGKVDKVLARKGKGPGEVLDVLHMERNDSKYFVSDVGNARILIYDIDFRLQQSIEGVRAMRFSVNNEFLCYRNMINSGAPASGLVSIIRINSPEDSVAQIMPKIIPDGYQPRVFNAAAFDINKHNEVAASYTYLPWIFLFDDSFDLERTLIFEGSEMDKRNLLPLNIYRGNSGSALGYERAFSNFKLSDTGDLYITDQLGIIHLKRKEDRSYEAVKLYSFHYPDIDEAFTVGYFDVFEEKYISAVRWYEWFSVNLNEN